MKHCILFITFLLFLPGCLPTGSPDTERRDYTADVKWPASPNPACPQWLPGSTVHLTHNLTLPEGCTYNQVRIVINQPGITFDGGGVVMNGLTTRQRNNFDTPYAPGQAPTVGGIVIYGNEAGQRVEDVTIRNVQMLNYAGAVSVSFNLTATTKTTLKAGNRTIHDGLRAAAPQRLLFENLTIVNDHTTGIFLHRHVNHVRVVGSKVLGSGSAGVYLGDEGSHHELTGNFLEGNGYGYYDPNTRTRTARLSSATRREGIAVDGSANNLIADNTFRDNGYHAINLYRNCYQQHTQPDEFPRHQGASHNQITNNTFYASEDVWIAARQDRDLGGWDCGGERLPIPGSYWRDDAEFNSLLGNTFLLGAGVVVMDDNNTISSNRFAGRLRIAVGSQARTAIGDPVRDNTTNANEVH